MSSIAKLFSKKFNRSNGVALVLIALLTAIASEIKVIPFNGEAFRFGLGSITFFLLILIRPSLPYSNGSYYGDNSSLFSINWRCYV